MAVLELAAVAEASTSKSAFEIAVLLLKPSENAELASPVGPLAVAVELLGPWAPVVAIDWQVSPAALARGP